MAEAELVNQVVDRIDVVRVARRAHVPVAMRVRRGRVYPHVAYCLPPALACAAAAPDEPVHDQLLDVGGGHARVIAA